MVRHALQDKETRLEFDKERLTEASEVFDAVDLEETGEVRVTLDTNEKSGQVLPSLGNLVKIIQGDPHLSALTYELFSRKIMATGDLPWNRIEGNWSDYDDAALTRYLEMTYGYKIEQTKLFKQLPSILIDQGRCVHVVQDYIKGVTWDGLPRLDTLFIDALLADNTPLVKSVTRKALTGAVKRVFEPGCKFDYMTILVSEQGIGKSTLLSLLGGAWFSDSFDFKLEGKSQMEQLRGVWVVESPELKGLSKADIDATKAFLSKTSDRYRGAYEANTHEYPRSCVFFGSTNETAFLRDDTGNRRFWIVPCRQKQNTLSPLMRQIIEDKSYIRQVWAEAYQRYLEGTSLVLTPEEEKQMVEDRQEYEYESPFEEELRRFLEVPLPDEWEEATKEERQQYMMRRRGFATSGTLGRFQIITSYHQRMTVTGEEARNEWFAYMPNAKNVTASTCTKMMKSVEGWEKAPEKQRFRDYGVQRYFIRKDKVNETESEEFEF